MCGQSTAYNTYATLPYTNPLFIGFSCSQNVNKEIGFQQFKASYGVYQKSILHLRTFCPGVFFCENCGTINKEEYCCFNHIIIMLYLF